MKFKFSLRRLFLITTVVAVLVAFCDRLGLFEEVNFFVVVIATYCLVYAGCFAIFLLPRYWHQWKEFRARLDELSVTRSELEKEVQRKVALSKIALNTESSESDVEQSTLANQGTPLPE